MHVWGVSKKVVANPSGHRAYLAFVSLTSLAIREVKGGEEGAYLRLPPRGGLAEATSPPVHGVSCLEACRAKLPELGSRQSRALGEARVDFTSLEGNRWRSAEVAMGTILSAESLVT